MEDEKVERIPGAKLVDGQWQDLEGNALSNADLIRLREATEKAKAERARERKQTEPAAQRPSDATEKQS